MRVLVTVGTGYLGRTVVRTFASCGYEPVVFARTASRSGLPGILTDGDVRDQDSLQCAASGCDAICHMAALVSVWRPRTQDFDDLNVGGVCDTRWTSRRRFAFRACSTHLHFSRCRRAAASRRSKRTTTSGRKSPPTASPTIG